MLLGRSPVRGGCWLGTPRSLRNLSWRDGLSSSGTERLNESARGGALSRVVYEAGLHGGLEDWVRPQYGNSLILLVVRPS